MHDSLLMRRASPDRRIKTATPVFVTHAFQKRISTLSESERLATVDRLTLMQRKIDCLGPDLHGTNTKVLQGQEHLIRHAAGRAARIIYRHTVHPTLGRSILIEEVLLNHDYDRLGDHSIIESPEKWVPLSSLTSPLSPTLGPKESSSLSITLSPNQQEVYLHEAGAIVEGGSGSGKTTIEEFLLRELDTGKRALYVSPSPELVDRMKKLFRSKSEAIDCMTVQELAQSGAGKDRTVLSMREFIQWWRPNGAVIKDPFCAYTEFVTMEEARRNSPSFSIEDFKKVGRSRTLVPRLEREQFLNAFIRFNRYLENKGLCCVYQIDSPSLKYTEAYNLVLVDECQGLTSASVEMVLKTTSSEGAPWFFGDRLQAVGPYQEIMDKIPELAQKYHFKLEKCVLREDYRNPEAIVHIKNDLTHFLRATGSADWGPVQTLIPKSDRAGSASLLIVSPTDLQAIEKTFLNVADCVVIVPDAEAKSSCPLQKLPILTPEEAIGLEWKHVFAMNFFKKYGRTLDDEYQAIQEKELLDGYGQFARERRLSRFDEKSADLRRVIASLTVTVARSTEHLYFLEPARSSLPPPFISRHLSRPQAASLAALPSTQEEFQQKAAALRTRGLEKEALKLEKQAVTLKPSVMVMPLPPSFHRPPESAQELLDWIGISKMEQVNSAKKKQLELNLQIAAVVKSPLLVGWVESELNHFVSSEMLLEAGESFRRREGVSLHSLRNLLLSHPSVVSPLGEPPLTIACRLGDVDLVKRLLELSYSKEALDLGGQTATGAALSKAYDSALSRKRTTFVECAVLAAQERVTLRGVPGGELYLHGKGDLKDPSVEQAAYWYIQHFLTLFRERAVPNSAPLNIQSYLVDAAIRDVLLQMASTEILLPCAQVLSPLLGSASGKFAVQELNPLLSTLTQITTSLLFPSSLEEDAIELNIGEQWVSVHHLLSGCLLPEYPRLHTARKELAEELNELMSESKALFLDAVKVPTSPPLGKVIQGGTLAPSCQLFFSKLVEGYFETVAPRPMSLDEYQALPLLLNNKARNKPLKLSQVDYLSGTKDKSKFHGMLKKVSHKDHPLEKLLKSSARFTSFSPEYPLLSNITEGTNRYPLVTALIGNDHIVIQKALRKFIQENREEIAEITIVVPDGTFRHDTWHAVYGSEIIPLPAKGATLSFVNIQLLDALTEESTQFSRFDLDTIKYARAKLKTSPAFKMLCQQGYDEQKKGKDKQNNAANVSQLTAALREVAKIIEEYFPNEVRTEQTIAVKMSYIEKLAQQMGLEVTKQEQFNWFGWLPRELALEGSYLRGLGSLSCITLGSTDIYGWLPVQVVGGVVGLKKVIEN